MKGGTDWVVRHESRCHDNLKIRDKYLNDDCDDIR